MDFQPTNIKPVLPRTQSSDSNGIFSQRLDVLLAEIAEIDRKKGFNDYKEERFEGSLFEDPLTTEEAYSQFGLIFGLFLPTIVYAMTFWRTPGTILIIIQASFITGIIGYRSGKFIGGIVKRLEEMSWVMMLLGLPFVGVLWGIIAGGASGFIFFSIAMIYGLVTSIISGAGIAARGNFVEDALRVIFLLPILGTFLGAIIAAVLTAPAFSAMTVFHRLLKRGEIIERAVFLAIAAIITFVPAAFILSFSLFSL